MPWDFDGDPSDLEPEPEPEELEAVPDDSFDDVEELVPLAGPEFLAEQKLPPLQNKPLQFKPVEKAEEAVEELVPQGILLEITRLLENKELLEKHGDLVGLFHEMKRLCEFLPKAKREGFHAGMKRMQMDYIISKLSGKPGLMTVAESLRDKGLVSVPDEKYDIVERFDEPAVSARVIGLMRPLVQQLPNKNDALSLDGSLRNLLERLAVL